MRQVAITFGFLVCLAALALVVTDSFGKGTFPLASGVNIAPTGAGEIPLYPGAQVLENERDAELPGAGRFRLKTDSDPGTIVSYYKNVLPKNGWLLIEEGGNDTFTSSNVRALDFTWTVETKGTLDRRYLELTIYDVSAGQAEISAMFSPWPDPGKVPLYSDAQYVASEWSTDPNHGSPVYITTYTTNATPTDIMDFYKSRMRESGWTLDSESHPTPTSLVFYNSRFLSGVVISIAVEGNGLARVEMRASGDGFDPPSTSVPK